jgi:hypothetical protein
MASDGDPERSAAGSGRANRLAVLLFGLLLLVGSGRPVAAAELVMFVDTGCPWCLRWDREVGEAYERSEEGRRAPLRRLHISTARRSGLTLASAVTVTPTFVLVDGGLEVGRITGYPGADFFWGMLGELLARLAPPAPDKPRDAGSGPPTFRDVGPSMNKARGASAGLRLTIASAGIGLQRGAPIGLALKGAG